jgi:hypothetical protein
MKTMLLRSFTAPLVGLLVFTALAGTPQQASAAGRVHERPISDFLKAQGTFDFGLLFVPPAPNFLGADDPDARLIMSVDYAGLVDAACNGLANTQFAGKVKEKRLADGRAEVTVELFTLDAITWVAAGTDFAHDPVIFGVRWEDQGGQCVIQGRPALGNSMMKLTIINTRPGAPLPDLFQLLAAPLPGQELRAITFRAVAIGKQADGTWARAETRQVGRLKDGELQFSVETITVQPLRSKEADESLAPPLD